MKRFWLRMSLIVLVAVGVGIVAYAAVLYKKAADVRRLSEATRAQVQTLIDAKRPTQENENPFGADGKTRVLLIGLDARAGEPLAHCDAIQLIEIDSTAQRVTITAVPRGTYAPLPGTGHAPGDYYVSNACAIGGLPYGIEQIEKILGVKHDHLVFVGFSQVLGVVRQLGLPATETLQWLRLRQSYAVGEPQRAHNHSTFLKELLVRFTPASLSGLSVAWQYPLYTMVDTDLTFGQGQGLVRALIAMDLSKHPERIELAMRPSYAVAEIAYDPEHLDEYITSMLSPIAPFIPEGAYTGVTQAEAQQRLMDLINAKVEDAAFVSEAYEQRLWLQIEDAGARESVHFALVSRFAAQVKDVQSRRKLLAEYVLEMEYAQEDAWEQAGRELLAEL
jgi:hypothetical protein